MNLSKIVLTSVLFISMGLMVGCSSNSTQGTLELTPTQLEAYDGTNGAKAYVAVDGVIYDVTSAEEWNNGTHAGLHLAGTDASDVIESAPHGKSVLSNLPIVGTLVQD